MIGWILLSRSAVASAERALGSDQQGVRDEIGFLTLHQAFSDRLFPGTSVLHTRLRYALFIPWLILRSEGDERRLRRDLQTLTGQLRQTGETGVIGGTIWPREPAQPATMSYWSAIARWQILQPRGDGVVLGRRQVLRQLREFNRAVPAGRLRIDGEVAWTLDSSPFVTLPEPPAALLRSGQPLDFKLTAEERGFLRRQLMSVRREDGSQSLLGRLAERATPTAGISAVWHPDICRVADADDRRCLLLAGQASALTAIGRAVYSALVEQAKNGDTGENHRTFRDDLLGNFERHGSEALKLDVGVLRREFPGLPDLLISVVDQTLAWLRTTRRDLSALYEVYRQSEVSRKGPRARLGSTVGARRRRAEWNTEGAPHPRAEPLHYRWGNVRQLLQDLDAA